MYRKVITIFQQEITKNSKIPSPKGPDALNVLFMTQDLLVLILPYLPKAERQEAWNICSSGTVIGHPEGGVQKRGYRILMKSVEAGHITQALDVEDVIVKLTSSSDTVAAPAKRVGCFGLLWTYFSSSSF